MDVRIVVEVDGKKVSEIIESVETLDAMALELRVADLHRDDGGQSLADVVTGKIGILLLEQLHERPVEGHGAVMEFGGHEKRPALAGCVKDARQRHVYVLPDMEFVGVGNVVHDRAYRIVFRAVFFLAAAGTFVIPVFFMRKGTVILVMGRTMVLGLQAESRNEERCCKD